MGSAERVRREAANADHRVVIARLHIDEARRLVRDMAGEAGWVVDARLRQPLLSERRIVLAPAQAGVLPRRSNRRSQMIRVEKRCVVACAAVGGEAKPTRYLKWWARLGSNQRPLRCERSALPLSYAPLANAARLPDAGFRRDGDSAGGAAVKLQNVREVRFSSGAGRAQPAGP